MNFLKTAFAWLTKLFSKVPTEVTKLEQKIEKVLDNVPKEIKEVVLVAGEFYLDEAKTKFQQFTHLQRVLFCLAAKEKCTYTDTQRMTDLDNEIKLRIEKLQSVGIEVEATVESVEQVLKKYK